MSEADAVRRSYEASLSWRVTKPLRAAGRRARALRPEGDHRRDAPAATPAAGYDGWLEAVAGAELAELDAACAAALAEGRPIEALAGFAALDVDTWAMLLTGEHEAWPGIRGVLPTMPDPVLQEWWNGASGARLMGQSARFYEKVVDRVATYGERPLQESRVLDHGCGWGRLLRLFSRDVAPGSLLGVDPTASILAHCREDRVPAELHEIDPLEPALPVGDVDVAYSFSVFTHVSESAADRALRALHGALRPGGLLVATVRPPDYLELSAEMTGARAELGDDWRAALREPRHVFVPHEAAPEHPQFLGGEMTYGEAIVTVPFVRERWAPRFELLDVAPLLGDLHQLVLTLRRSA